MVILSISEDRCPVVSVPSHIIFSLVLMFLSFGFLFEGFVNRRESRMMMQKNITEIKVEIDKENEQLAVLTEELQRVDGKSDQISNCTEFY